MEQMISPGKGAWEKDDLEFRGIKTGKILDFSPMRDVLP
jgi:hypothetical protein